MSEEVKTQTNVTGEGTQGKDTTQEYLDAIKDLKQNSVSRADYDKLRAENRQLLDAVVNGTQSVEIDTTEEHADKLKQAYTDLFVNRTDNMSNLEFVEKALFIRDEAVKAGKPDPFEWGNDGCTSACNIVDGAKIAEGLHAFLDEANGDPAMFDAIYKRDVNPTKHFPQQNLLKK